MSAKGSIKRDYIEDNILPKVLVSVFKLIQKYGGRWIGRLPILKKVLPKLEDSLNNKGLPTSYPRKFLARSIHWIFGHSIFYLDYENGDDANDGSTWALAWKTITTGATAARIAGDDTIRIAKSPDPTSLGINATWTDKNFVVTLASALTQNIDDCDVAWTPTADVSYSAQTYYRKQGTQSIQLSIADAFTTGKAGYHATGALDLSGYKQVSFWVYNNAALSAGVMKLALCSDVSGDTIVNNIPIPAIASTYMWVPITVNLGSALGASIQSIALYAISDPGTCYFRLDNIFACKDVTSADSLTLNSLISKNSNAQGGSEAWYSIQNILGTRIVIGSDAQQIGDEDSYSLRGYSGTTETVTTYKRETIKTSLATSYNTVVQEVQDSGTSGHLITFSGGWNTSTTVRDGETYFDGQTRNGYGIVLNGKSYVEFLGVSLLRYYCSVRLTSASNNAFTIFDLHGSTGFYYETDSDNNTITITNVHNCSYYGLQGMSSCTGNTITITNLLSIHGGYYDIQISGTAETVNITNIKNGNSTGFYVAGTNCDITIGTIDVMTTGVHITGLLNRVTVTTMANTTYYALQLEGANNFVELTDISGDGTDYGIYLGGNGNTNTVVVSGTISDFNYGIYSYSGYNNKIINALVTGNATGGVYLNKGVLYLENCEVADVADLIVGSSGDFRNARIHANKYDKTIDNHKILTDGGLIASEGTVRHTASGIAWKLSPTSANRSANYPLRLTIAKIAVVANKLVTVKAYVRRNNTGITGKLVCPGKQIAGVASDVVDTASAAADNWEELEITFTPTEAGVVEIEAWAYGGTTYNLYVDDMTINQAS